jgi:hypothetical protein
MKTMKNSFGLPIVVVLVLIVGVLGYVMGGQKSEIHTTATPSTSLADLPTGWHTQIVDDSKCYSIQLENKGFSGDNIETFVKKSLSLASLDGVIEKNKPSYPQSSNVITLGQTGVNNLNTVYLKSQSGMVYMIVVNSTPENRKPSTFCNSADPVINSLVTKLL